MQFVEQAFDLATAADGGPDFSLRRFGDFHMLEVVQIDDHVAGNDRLAPGVPRADDADLLARMPVENLEDVRFSLRRVIAARSEADVPAEIHDIPCCSARLLRCGLVRRLVGNRGRWRGHEFNPSTNVMWQYKLHCSTNKFFVGRAKCQFPV